MADKVEKVSYCYVRVPDRAGRGATVLAQLHDAGINLLGYSGFPVAGGKAQLDFVAEDIAPIQRIARQKGWKPSPVKKGFLIRGRDEIGAVHHHIQRLANAKISVTAADAVCAGKGRYGMILWVKPKDYARAAKVLHAE
jgi:hypothetical protein